MYLFARSRSPVQSALLALARSGPCPLRLAVLFSAAVSLKSGVFVHPYTLTHTRVGRGFIGRVSNAVFSLRTCDRVQLMD